MIVILQLYLFGTEENAWDLEDDHSMKIFDMVVEVAGDRKSASYLQVMI